MALSEKLQLQIIQDDQLYLLSGCEKDIFCLFPLPRSLNHEPVSRRPPNTLLNKLLCSEQTTQLEDFPQREQ